MKLLRHRETGDTGLFIEELKDKGSCTRNTSTVLVLCRYDITKHPPNRAPCLELWDIDMCDTTDTNSVNSGSWWEIENILADISNKVVDGEKFSKITKLLGVKN